MIVTNVGHLAEVASIILILAHKIEDVIMWQPETEDAALVGSPDDPRFKYINMINFRTLHP